MKNSYQYSFEVAAWSGALILILWQAIYWLVGLLRGLPVYEQAPLVSFCSLVGSGAIAGSFNLTYEKTRMWKTLDRFLAHGTKFFLYLSIGLLFEIALTGIAMAAPGFHNDALFIVACFLFFTLLIYNFWDLRRSSNGAPDA